MHQALLLIDFVGLYAVLICQSEDAILSWSDISPTQINPLCLLILKKEKQTIKTITTLKHKKTNINIQKS